MIYALIGLIAILAILHTLSCYWLYRTHKSSTHTLYKGRPTLRLIQGMGRAIEDKASQRLLTSKEMHRR